MPKLPPHRSHEAAMSSGNSENATELQHRSCSTADQETGQNISCRPWLPNSASPAPPEPTETQSSLPNSHARPPPTSVESPAREPNIASTGPTAGSTPSQSLDVHNKRIIAASATLAYLQSRFRRETGPTDFSDNSTCTKVKALTRLCKGLLRDPGETIAISADIFQSEILLTVAHDDGSPIPPETGMSEGEQPGR